MSRRGQEFQTIRSEGGLLPPDLLRRVIDPRSNLPGTSPKDYGLPEGERLNEVITQSWNRLRKHWAEFRTAAANLPEGEAGTGLTNDRWSLPLLRELGFGFLPASAGPEVQGRSYPISRFFGPVPVHLVGCGLSLDRRAAGQRGAAAGNPHGLVQEFLNRSAGNLWAIVSNGLRLRVMRDNQALSRQSFLEFDVEAMFAGEVYSDFVLLWLMAHATRFAPREADRPETCWLEVWTREAEEQGTRALGDLRGGVERALQVLGEGFVGHPKNAALRDSLRSGQLSLNDFHGQLLRVVYRLIFLFVAEDRTLDGKPLLHPPDESAAAVTARERYASSYSTARLREMAGRIKGSRHGDLWRQFQLLVGALSGDPAFAAAREHLALPALGSFLWDPASTAALNDTEITNYDVLEALRHLAFTRQGNALRPVDYRNLGAEELGGVYETLLALTPQISADGARFTFAEFAGNERRTSGSYYTPDSLVQCLLDSALDPVVADTLKGKSGAEAEQAILGLKVCDPAVGSGHFLVGAAHRLARHLARVRAEAGGESEPSPLLYQHALRDVIGRCLYGVDINPMAAELCRVSLWLEALEPGRPLSFLDHHIRVGNSLVGAAPDLVEAGLPDDAFKPIEGDESDFCSALKRRNREEREGRQLGLDLQAAEPRASYDAIASGHEELDERPDDSFEAVQGKAAQFCRLTDSPEYRRRKRVADAWCAAFVWRKVRGAPNPITTDTIRRLERDANALSLEQQAELEELTKQYQFFHWKLAFPEVFARTGFDCVLGNPPWEKIQIEESKFFAYLAPDIATARAQKRKAAIAGLKAERPSLYVLYKNALRRVAGQVHQIKTSGRFPLSGGGNVSTHSLFIELCVILNGGVGSTGLVVPSGLATQDSQKHLFRELTRNNRLSSLFDFENRLAIFPDVDSRFRFCLVTIRQPSKASTSLFAFFLDSPEAIKQDERLFSLTFAELERLSPNTGSCPQLSGRMEAALLTKLYSHGAVILNESSGENPWGWHSWQMINETHESALLSDTGEESGAIRLYEAKLFHQFDHRYATYVSSDITKHASDEQRLSPDFCVSTRYFVAENLWNERVKGRGHTANWIMAFRRITNATNQRTAIFSVLPVCGAGSQTPVVTTNCTAEVTGSLLANLNSFAFDFAARRRVGGTDLNHFIIHQLPTLPRDRFTDACTLDASKTHWAAWVSSRTLELTYTAWDLEPFARDCRWDGPPFRWDEQRRFLLRCELDAAFFRLYLPADEAGNWRLTPEIDGRPNDEAARGITELRQHFPNPRHAVAYIMDTFPLVRRKDEEKYDGDYRTKRIILEIYDDMQDAIRTGKPYQSRLDPPPGPPLGADGTFVQYADIAANPPPHIHLPRDGSAVDGMELQLSDLGGHFPGNSCVVRLGSGANAPRVRVRPVRPEELRAGARIVLASTELRRNGAEAGVAIGKLRVESRTDATTGSAYLLVSVKGDDGLAQARFSEDQWRNLTTVGVVEDLD
ncbi:MAG: N-6 DNA methylase [Chromatiales bacterium]|nr:N-6 DNA methylase [Chromatiales bacterium]